MRIIKEGSVRVDLAGGTLDIDPIHLILPNVVTLNVATSLKAQIEITEEKTDSLILESLDYKSVETFSLADFTWEKIRSDFFGPLNLVAALITDLQIDKGLRIKLKSGSPPGAGLGGSSAMAITLYQALVEASGKNLSKKEIFQRVKDIEAMILDCGPTGYQDYYPALYGGILALNASAGGVEIEQLYSPELKGILENNLTLISSNETRFSAINNWQVYQGFFNRDPKMRKGLQEINIAAQELYAALKAKDANRIAKAIIKEGEIREHLFEKILSPKMLEVKKELSETECGIKVCGAGGGGCFLVVGEKIKIRSKLDDLCRRYEMQQLDFVIEPPLAEDK